MIIKGLDRYRKTDFLTRLHLGESQNKRILVPININTSIKRPSPKDTASVDIICINHTSSRTVCRYSVYYDYKIHRNIAFVSIILPRSKCIFIAKDFVISGPNLM